MPQCLARDLRSIKSGDARIFLNRYGRKSISRAPWGTDFTPRFWGIRARNAGVGRGSGAGSGGKGVRLVTRLWCLVLSISTGSSGASRPIFFLLLPALGGSSSDPAGAKARLLCGCPLAPRRWCRVPGPGAGAGYSRAGQRERGAVSGKHSGSNGRSANFLRQGAQGSAPGVSPASRVS